MRDYTHLTLNDRQRLYTYLDMGLSIRSISKKLLRHPSTLYREVNRNKEHHVYLPGIAHQYAVSRASNGRRSKLEKDGYLRDYVCRSLKKGWSPEQISGRMKYQKLTIYVCPETIYQYIYKSKNKELYHCLPYKQAKRYKRYSRKQHHCRFGGDMRLITERPADINSRTRFGHWEGDTIQFMGNKKKVVTTLVERKSRMVFLIKNNSKHSKGVMERIGNKFENLPQQMLKSITFDQGVEFADYRYLEDKMSCNVYYCETHSPWQKGSNENMNGRIRRYLPKTTTIDNVTQKELDLLADK
ncbi:IS30 family transposase, partial [Legionella parisiensis]